MTEPFTAHQEPPRARLLGDDVTATTEIEPIRDSPNGFRGVEFPPLERRRGQPDEPSFDDILDTYGGSSTHDTGRNGHHPPPRRRRIDPGEGPRRR